MTLLHFGPRCSPLGRREGVCVCGDGGVVGANHSNATQLGGVESKLFISTEEATVCGKHAAGRLCRRN